MSKEVKTDVSIVGAGVTGLMLTRKLTDLGYDVALIEKQGVIGAGPSTKNEGWLHRGTYHATSIKDEEQALKIAKRCIYGHEEIRRYAPEAVEDIGYPTYAVIGNDELAHQAVDRWDKAGVLYKPISIKDFSSINPEVDAKNIKHVFEVGDISINTRMLYQKLLVQSEKNGAKIFLRSHLIPRNPGSATLVQEGSDKLGLYSNMFIVTAGYSIKDIFREVTGDELPVRYWKSHLLVFPRMTKNSTFYLDPGEVALFNHGSNSVIGQHEDAVTETEPNFDVVPERAKLVFEATKRLVPRAQQYDDAYLAIACIKPDIAHYAGQSRSLDVSILHADDNHLFTLPGKMTEAPYVVDRIVQMVFNWQHNKTARIALRPCDMYKVGQDDRIA